MLRSSRKGQNCWTSNNLEMKFKPIFHVTMFNQRTTVQCHLFDCVQTQTLFAELIKREEALITATCDLVHPSKSRTERDTTPVCHLPIQLSVCLFVPLTATILCLFAITTRAHNLCHDNRQLIVIAINRNHSASKINCN